MSAMKGILGMENIKIALDGPAGAGKSTVAKAVAQKLDIIYIDTGAMYRTAALYMIRHGIDIKKEKEKLISHLDGIKMDIRHTEQGQRMILGDEDVSDKIRTEEVSMGASDIAVIPQVRLKLVDMQRELAKSKSVIMDGRDIGTYVLQDAELKIFLTATPECRAERRYKELTERGVDCRLEDILKDILKRDKNDSEREFAPLKCADDAVYLDTTDLTRDEVIETIVDLYNNLK